eukprot:PhF_6_TR39023/c0_g1_i1/m.58407/K03858/PIGH, GPI15; phosphatidylinositol glycan, class H
MSVQIKQRSTQVVEVTVTRSLSHIVSDVLTPTVVLSLFVAWVFSLTLNSICLCVGIVTLLFCARTVRTETLIVAKDVAVQLWGQSVFGNTVYHSCVDVRCLCGVFINEGFIHHTVKYYLCVVYEGVNKDRKVDVAFQSTMPRLNELKEIYKHCQSVLR